MLLDTAGASAANKINARYYSGFNANKTIGGMNTSGTVTFSGVVTMNDSVSLTADAGGTALFSGTIKAGSATGGQAVNGTPGINKVGAGTVWLTGTNTYAGLTTISAGTIKISGDRALGAVPGSTTANSITIHTNASLLAAETITLDSKRGITMNGIGFIGADSGKTLTYGGVIAGSGLVKNGAGTLTLSGNNTYTGSTIVSNGVLVLTGAGSSLGSGSDVRIANGASLILSNSVTVASIAEASNSNGGTADLASGVTLTVNGANKGVMQMNAFTGAGGVTMAGTGTSVLQLYGANTYSGNTIISSGGLYFSDGATIPNSPVIQIANGATLNVSDRTSALTLGAQTLRGPAGTGTGRVWANTDDGLTLGASSILDVPYYASGTAPLQIDRGVLTLNAGGTVTVYNAGSALSGTTDSPFYTDYVLVSKANGGSVAGTAPGTLTITGNGIASGYCAVLVISGDQLVMRVYAPSAGGTVNSPTICSGATAQITVSGYVGSILGWQSSPNGTDSWSDIGSTAGYTTYTTAVLSANAYYRAKVDNACSDTVYSGVSTVTVITAPAQPGTITGDESVCANTAGKVYSITAVSGATNYIWTVPSGATITAGQGSTSITVTFGTNSGNVSVSAQNFCGTSSARTLAVTVNSTPAQPGTITGDAAVCANEQGVAYSIEAVNGATTYSWSVPSGATVASGQGTTSITVNFGSSAGDVSVTAGNTCGTSAARTKAVTITPVPEQPGAITGDILVCAGAERTYTIDSVSGATGYTWTFPAGTTTNSGGGTTSITVTWGSTSGDVTVTPFNECGNGTPQTLAVSTGGSQGGTIHPATNVVLVGTSTTIVLSNHVGGTIAWYKSTTSAEAGFAVIDGQTTTNLTTGALTTRTWFKSSAAVGDCDEGYSEVIAIGVRYYSDTWTGGGANDNTLTETNWASGYYPQPGTTSVMYFAGSTRLTPNFNYADGGPFGSIYFNSGASSFNVGGSPITLHSLIRSESANAQTISNSITLGAAATLESTAGNLTLAGAIANGDKLLTVNPSNNRTITLGGVISGTGGLTKNSAGSAVLTGENTYTGETIINQGTLSIDGTTDPLDTSGITLGPASGGGAATLRIALSGTTVDSPITVRAGTADNATITYGVGSGTGTFTGNIAVNKAVTISANAGGTLALGGVISGAGAITKGGTGTGIAILSGDNTFTNTVTISAGTLRISHANALGAATAGTTIESGDTLEIIGGINSPEPLTNAGSLTSVSGANTFSGTIALTADTSVGVTADSLTLGGIVSGNYGVTKIGNGTLILSGANTYTGLTTVSVGAIRIANNAALGAATAGTVVGSGDALEIIGGITSAEPLSVAGTGISSGGVLRNISGANTLSGAVTLTANSSVAVDDGSLTLGGAVGGAFTLTKAGNGTLTLSGANTYSGATTISAGQVVLGNASGLGVTNAGTTISSGAALDVNGQTIGDETITMGGSGIGSAGAILNSSASAASISGGVLLSADTTIGTPSGELTLSGRINETGGAFNLTKVGTGTLTLAGDNLVDGVLYVTAGTVKLGNNAALGSAGAGKQTEVSTGAAVDLNGATVASEQIVLSGAGVSDSGALYNSSTTAASLTGAITLTNGATIKSTGTGGLTFTGGITLNANTVTFDGANNFTVSSTKITGTGGLIKNGAGALTLNVANDFTGNTTINAGSVVLGSGGTLASPVIAMAAGTTIDVTAKGSAYTLAGQTLRGPTAAGTATIAAGSNDGLTLDASSTLVAPSFATGTAAFNVTGGPLSLNAATTVIVTNTGTALAVGSHKLISVASSGSVVFSGVAPAVTVAGGGIDGNCARLELSGGELYIVVYAATVAGEITPSESTICAGASVNLVLGGNTGAVVKWQSSSNGSDWSDVSSTATTLSVSPGASTYYRAVVQNGCSSAANTASVLITVDPQAAGGYASPAAQTVCNNSPANLILTNAVGSSYQWQVSSDGSTGWANVTTGSGGTTTNYTTAAMTGTLYYRVIVSSGVCAAPATSTVASVSVTADPSITVQPQDQIVCVGSPGTFSVTASGTSNYQWQVSTDSGSNWENVASGGTSASYETGNTTTGMNGYKYRVLLTGCGGITITSSVVTLTVQTEALGGTATAVAGVVIVGTEAKVNLTGHSGTITWQQSIDGGTVWSNITGQSGTTLTIASLLADTKFRAIANAGSCGVATSTVASVRVRLYQATWDGLGGDDNMLTETNWAGDLYPASSATNVVTFAGTQRTTPVNNYTAGSDFGSIILASSSDPFTITGNSMDLFALIQNSDDSLLTLNNDLVLGSNITVNAASGNIALGGTVSGANGLTKTGDKTLIVTGTNTFSGAVTVSAGELNVRSAGALGTTAAGTTVSSGGTLALQGGITISAEPLILNGSGANSGGALRNVSGNNTYGGTVSLNDSSSIFVVNGTDTLTVSGLVSGGATANLTKTGPGTLVLNANNSFTGILFVEGGVLSVPDISSTVDAAQPLGRKATTGSLFPIQLGSASYSNSERGTLRYTGAGQATLPKVVNLISGTESGIDLPSGSGELTISGVIRGGSTTASFYKTGSGRLVISGVNSYDGRTFVDAGALRIDNAASLGNASASDNHATYVTGSGAALEITGGITTAERIFINGTGISGAGALRNVSGNNTLSDYVTLQSDSTIAVDDGTRLTMTSQLRGTANLTMKGPGTLALNAQSLNYTGKVTIVNGTIEMDGPARLGPAPGSFQADAITLDGGTLSVVNTNIPGNANRGVTITANGGTFSVGSGASVLFNGAITGAGTLTKTGAGVLTLGANNTHSGDIIITNGTLALTNNAVINSSPNIKLEAGATLSVAPRTSAYTLTGSTLRSPSGAGTGTILAGSDDGLTIATALTIPYFATNAAVPLQVSGGVLTIDSGAILSVHVTVDGGTLTNGVYRLIGKTGDGSVALSGATTLIVSISGANTPANTCAAAKIIDGELYLAVDAQAQTPGAISGPSEVCEGTEGVTYSISEVPNADSYTWTVPADAEIVGTATGTVITVNFGSIGGNVTVAANTDCGTGSAQVRPVTVSAEPLITAEPASQTVCAGTTVEFSVTASGANLSYQWYKNGTTMPGETNATLTLTNVEASDAGTAGPGGSGYYVLVTGCGTKQSEVAGLTVDSGAVILVQPASLAPCFGGDAVFSVVAAGSSLSYQWYKGGVALSNGGRISGATSDTLVITAIESGDLTTGTSTYYVVVSGTGNCGGTTTSEGVTLTEGSTPQVFTWRGEAENGNWQATGSVAPWWSLNEATGYGRPGMLSEVLVNNNNQAGTWYNNVSDLTITRLVYGDGATSARTLTGNNLVFGVSCGATAAISNRSATVHAINLNIERIDGTAMIIDSGSAGLSISGAISGEGALTKSGSGTLTLTGTNTFGGILAISAGTVQVGDGGTSGSMSPLSITNDGTVAWNRSGDVSYVGAISGTGKVLQQGGGRLTLSGGSSFAGGLYIDGGDVLLSGNNTAGGTGLIYVGSETDVNKSASLTVGSGRNITNLVVARATPLDRVVIQNEGAGSVELSGGIRLLANDNEGGTTTTIISNTPSGNMVIGMIDLATPEVDNRAVYFYNNVTIGGVTNAGVKNFVMRGSGTVTINGGVHANFYQDSGDVIWGQNFTVPQAVLYQFGTVDNKDPLVYAADSFLQFTKAGSYNVNFVVGQFAETGNPGKRSMLFTHTADTAVVAGTLNLGTYANRYLVMSNAQPVEITGNISGQGGLHKIGAGLLTLSGNASHESETRVEDGSLKLASYSALSAGAPKVVLGYNTSANNVSLLIGNGSFMYTPVDVVAGTGTRTLAMDEAGQAFIDANITLNRQLILNTPSGATLTIADSSRKITGSSGIEKTGDGTVVIAGANDYTGGTTISGGTLQVGAGGSSGQISGAITNKAALVFNRIGTLSHSGVISGSGSVTKLGNGTLTLSGANTFSGGLYVEAGTVVAGSAGSMGDSGNGTVYLGATTGEAAANVFTASGRNNPIVVRAGSTGVKTIGNSGGSSVVMNGALTVNDAVTLDAGTGTLRFAMPISGSSAITIDGGIDSSDFVSFSTNNSSYTGPVTVRTGTLRLANDAALGASNIVTVNAGAELDVDANVTLGGLSGDTGSKVSRPSSGADTLTVQNTADYTFAGVMENGSGTLALTKAGAGTFTLSGNNTYSGNTAINAGTLVLSGSAANSAVSVASGATLRGAALADADPAGVVKSLAVSGTVAPGTDSRRGKLVVAEGLTFNSGSTFAVKVGDASLSQADNDWEDRSDVDHIIANGSVTVNGAVTVAVTASADTAAKWDKNQDREWILIRGGISSTNNFSLDVSGWTPAVEAGGGFYLEASGGNLKLVYDDEVGIPTTPVQNIAVSPSGWSRDNTFTVSWTAPTGGASSYRVVDPGSAGGESTVTELSATVTVDGGQQGALTGSVYAASADNDRPNDGGEGPGLDYTVRVDTTVPLAVSVTEETLTGGEIGPYSAYIQWTPASAIESVAAGAPAGTTLSPFATYRIYYTENSSTDSFPAGTDDFYFDFVDGYPELTDYALTGVVLNNLNPGSTYRFAVAAVDEAGNVSSLVNAGPAITTAMFDITNAYVTAGNDIVLQWSGNDSAEYDIIYTDAEGYNEAAASAWRYAGTVASGEFTDTGDVTGEPIALATNRMRFYRIAPKDSWVPSDAREGIASSNVVAAKVLRLQQGHNIVGFSLEPFDKTMKGTFGVDRLPTVNNYDSENNTQIHIYRSSVGFDVAPGYYSLWAGSGSGATWMYMPPVGDEVAADASNAPVHEVVSFRVPEATDYLMVGRVFGFMPEENLNISVVTGELSTVTLRYPYPIKLRDIPGLKNIQGYLSSARADRIMIIDNSKNPPGITAQIYLRKTTTMTNLTYITGGTGSAEDRYLQPFESIIFRAHPALTSGTGTTPRTDPVTVNFNPSSTAKSLLPPFTNKITTSISARPSVARLSVVATGQGIDLRGQINPNRLATEYWFKYGTTEAYGTTTAAGSLPVLAKFTNVSAYVTGLSSGSRYFYALVASNSMGMATSTASFVYGCPTITFATTSLPEGTKGSAYSGATFEVSGGAAPYTYAISSGSLPAGLTNTTGGVLSGTPSEGGTFTFTVTATDANGCLGSSQFSLSITDSSKTPQTGVQGVLAASAITYGQTTTVTASGGQSSGTYQFRKASGTASIELTGSGETRTITPISIGTAVIEVRKLGDATYQDSAWTSAGTLTITAKVVTVTGAMAVNKVYDGTTAIAITNATLSGVLTNDSITVSGGGTVTSKAVGTNKAVTAALTLGGAQAGNYQLTQPTGLTASITTKPATVSGLSINTKIFDGNTTATASGTAVLEGKVLSDSVTLGGTPSFTFASAEPGVNIAVTVTGYTLSGTDAGNYSLIQPTNLTGTITGANPVGGTATAASATVCYNSGTTITLSGHDGAIQWQSSTDGSNYSNVSGQTGTNLATGLLTASRYYRAIVTVGANSATSSVATVTVTPFATVTTSPESAAVCAGGSVNLTVAASGATSYQWLKSQGWGSGNAWTVTSGGSGVSGVFTGSSITNGNGTAGIDTSGKAWGLYSSFGQTSEAVRNFPAMSAGQMFQVDLDTGSILPGSAVGIGLRNSSDADLVEFYFVGGASTYSLAASGVTPSVNIPFTSNGLRFTLKVTSSTTFEVLVEALNGDSTYGPFTGSFSATGPITRFRAYNYNPKPQAGPEYDFFINNLRIGPAIGAPFYEDNAANYALGWSTGDNFGFSPVSGATSTTLSIGSASAGDAASYAAVAYNSCGGALSAKATVTVGGTAGGGGVTAAGAATICAGSTTTISLSGQVGSITKWQSSSNGSVWSDVASTANPYTTAALSATTYFRAVVQSGACDPVYSTTSIVTVTSGPAQPGVISGSTNVVTNTSYNYSITPVAGATNHVWSVPSGATITSGQGSPTITVLFGAGGGTISVVANNSCGAGSPRTLNVTVATAPVDATWTGAGSDDYTMTAANWIGGLAPAAGTSSVLRFTGSTRTSPVINHTAASAFASILFEAGASAFNLRGNAITLHTSVLNNSSNMSTVGNAITLGGAVEMGGSGGLTITNSISGSAAITKTGSGMLEMKGSSSFSGTMTISAGQVKVSNSSALGTTSGGTVVSSGAALVLGPGLSVGAEPLTLNGTGGGAGALANSTASAATFAGNVSLGMPARINSSSGSQLVLSGNVILGAHTLTMGGTGTSVVSGVISGTGGLTKDGLGRVTLSSANSYTGPTLINQGVVALTGSGSLASTNIAIASGATFDLSGRSGDLTLGAQTLRGPTSAGTGTLAADDSGVVLGATSKLEFPYFIAGSVPLNVIEGTVSLNSATAVVINNAGTALTNGSYKIISATSSGAVSFATSAPVVTVTGAGVGTNSASLVISSGELFLSVQ